MAAINNEQKIAFFQRVNQADRQAAVKPSTPPFLSPVTPVDENDVSDHLEERQKTYKSLYRKRTVLELHVDSRQKQLYQLNPIIFKYLNDTQKKVLVEELNETKDLLNRVIYMDAVENRRDRIEALDQDVKTCQKYIAWIQSNEEPKGFDDIPEQSVPSWAKGPIGSMVLLPIYSRLKAIWDAPIDTPLNAMNQVNNLRLYWVWVNSLIDVLFTLCKEFDLINLEIFNKLEKELQWPAPITGNLSWSLYYLRFLLRIYVCIRPILPGISEEQKGVSTSEQLLTNFSTHKFSLLNDIIWGTVNLACYFWLTYRKNANLGHAGDLLTAGFLIMDWIFSYLDYLENQKKYYKNCQSLEEDIHHLEQLLQQTKEETERNALKLKLANAKQRLADYQFDFSFTSFELVNSLIYASLLMLSFPLLIGLVAFPGSLAASAGVILAGALLCFAVTVIFQAVNNLIPVIKSNSQRKRLIQYRDQLEDLLRETKDVDQQKIIMVQMNDLEKMIEYHKKEAIFHSFQFLRALAFDIFFPALVFVALFTVSLGTGGTVGIIAAGFALNIASNWYLNRFEPSKPDKVELSDEQLSEQISDLLKQEPKKTSAIKGQTLFKRSPEQEVERLKTADNDIPYQPALFCPA